MAELLATGFGVLGSITAAAFQGVLVVTIAYAVLRTRSLAAVALLSFMIPIISTVTYGGWSEYHNALALHSRDPLTTQFFAVTAFVTGCAYVFAVWMAYYALKAGDVLGEFPR
ncbi:MAG: hypothetical protein ABW136_05360 [Steroidobacteraceae bacterium]